MRHNRIDQPFRKSEARLFHHSVAILGKQWTLYRLKQKISLIAAIISEVIICNDLSNLFCMFHMQLVLNTFHSCEEKFISNAAAFIFYLKTRGWSMKICISELNRDDRAIHLRSLYVTYLLIAQQLRLFAHVTFHTAQLVVWISLVRKYPSRTIATNLRDIGFH